MRLALLTNSKLSVPAINVLAGRGKLVSVGIPSGKGSAEELDHISFTAAQFNVPVQSFATQNLSLSLTEWLDACKPDAVFVFTFPFKIPSAVLKIPLYGFINFHFGLLPSYRGADAIFWQIKNRENFGGISVHQMTERFDRGPLFLVHKVPIHPFETYGSHLLKLSVEAIAVVEKILQGLQSGILEAAAQDESQAAYYHRPQLADVVIDWHKPAADIIALVNAANPWNKGAVACINQYPIKIIAVTKAAERAPAHVPPGTIVKANQKSGCQVSCGSEELITLDILYCNDSFITGIQFVELGITEGVRFEKMPDIQVA
jgi:methionyl-tRNA formyltransferase